MYAALHLALGLTEVKNIEMKRAKYKDDKSGYTRKSRRLLLKREPGSRRQEGRYERKETWNYFRVSSC